MSMKLIHTDPQHLNMIHTNCVLDNKKKIKKNKEE